MISPPGRVYRQKIIDRADIQNRRNAIFVYGDNMRRTGFGGQAKAMRGEPNAIGVPTKWAPDTQEKSYFSDGDFDRVRSSIDNAFLEIRTKLGQGFDIVIPTNGLGTGLARLPQKAPRIHRYIEKHIAALVPDTSAPQTSEYVTRRTDAESPLSGVT